jgi:hypothetical protein
LKSFFGLSGSIYAQIYLAFFVVGAAGGGDSLKSTLVIIFGCANSLGRMAAGSGSDFLKARVSRPGCYAIFLGIMCLGLGLFAATPSNVARCGPNVTSSGSSESEGVPLLLFMGISVMALTLLIVPLVKEVSPEKVTKLSSKGGYSENRRVLSTYVGFVGRVCVAWCGVCVCVCVCVW